MKNPLRMLLLSLALAGCAAGPTPQMVAYTQFVSTNRPKAEAGILKWSDYYAGLYAAAMAANAPAAITRNFSGMIDIAMKYESGGMTKDEFMRERRNSQVSVQADVQAGQQAKQREDADRASMALAYIATHPIPSVQPIQPLQTNFVPIQQAQPQIIGPMGFLQGQSINGMLRYCRYSNGVVNTISSVALCPLNTSQ